MEIYEKLDNAISDALDKLDTSSSTYLDDAKVVVELYNVKNQAERNQNDYYVRAEELANETERIEQQKNQEKKDSKWYNKINYTQVMTVVIASVTTVGMMGMNMAFQKEGYIGISPAELIKVAFNKVK